jgi:MarR family transcriptional regulator, transcriptional regulator for hemolysin
MCGDTLAGMPMPDPFPVPMGLRLNQTARAVGRAFDQALAEAGGSLPVWLVLLNLKIRQPGTQRELADAVGITEATLTHHLTAMDTGGLITRTRDASNRRVQVVALTAAGEAAFLRLRDAAIAFDARLNAGVTESEAATLTALLAKLVANVGADGGGPPWAGVIGQHGAAPPAAARRQPVSGKRGSAAPARAAGR